jgi:hypothetical protein
VKVSQAVPGGRTTVSHSAGAAGRTTELDRTGPDRPGPGRTGPGRGRWVRLGWHAGLLAGYLAAGVGVTWPRAAYLTGRLPRTRDVATYVWSLQWMAHQLVHLGNPWFTTAQAAPAGVQLGFDTTLPLPAFVLAPVTLLFGPSASFTLLSVAAPGLACYAAFRAARLWLRWPGAIAAGALFGLSSMFTWQAWYHLNIGLGTIFLPLTLEAVIRLRRRPRAVTALALGLILGATLLVNQESAVVAAALAGIILAAWLVRGKAMLHRLGLAALAGVAALVVASPQLVAMLQQAVAGGATIQAGMLSRTYSLYGIGLPTMTAPSPRLRDFGLGGLASAYTYRAPMEDVATFGVTLTALALAGLLVSRRRPAVWWLAGLWAGCAALALGPTLIWGTRVFVPLAGHWHGTRVSLLLPYTWLVRLPGLAGLREADRFALLGLAAAAILAGAAVDWLAQRARTALGGLALAVAAVAAVAEAGWAGNPGAGTMPTTLPALDRPIAADHSPSIVVDIPYGLRGGVPLFGEPILPPMQLLATSDGHPRAISYTAWVPVPTVDAIRRHPFYVSLAAAQAGRRISPAAAAAASRDARRMDIGWVLVWRRNPAAVRYLTAAGFRFSYRADGVSVYRPSGRPHPRPGRAPGPRPPRTDRTADGR